MSQQGCCQRKNRACVLFSLLALLIFAMPCYAQTASWYSVESCRREGTSGIMANGEVFNNEKLTCASWDYPFGTKLRITNLRNGQSVVVRVTDRGPAKRLYRVGRTIDLSKRAFSEIAELKQGVIHIEVSEVR